MENSQKQITISTGKERDNMRTYRFGNKSIFQIECTFIDKTKDTELAIYMKGVNVLAFYRFNEQFTTRWNLDDIALWLRNFINTLEEDPYPIDVEGDYAAIKDMNAREFDSDDEEEFDEYYDKLDEWCQRHCWYSQRNGAIIADLYFQLVGNSVEISWNNVNSEDGVEFLEKIGGASIDKDVFIDVVNEFLDEYADYWFGDNRK